MRSLEHSCNDSWRLSAIDHLTQQAALQENVAGDGVVVLIDKVCEVAGIRLRHDRQAALDCLQIQPKETLGVLNCCEGDAKTERKTHFAGKLTCPWLLLLPSRRSPRRQDRVSGRLPGR